MASKDSKNLALIMWLASIFFSFIPGLIIYFVKSDDRYLKTQSIEALNWGITILIIGFIANLILGSTLASIVGLCNLIFCILGAVAVSKGDDYQVPFAIRLIK